MTLKDYIRGIPIELRKAVSGLDNDIRLGIFLAVMRHGELSFSELSEKLSMKEDKAKLNFHLGKLTKSALIEHYYRHQLGNDKFSFYSTTAFGKNLWNTIVQSLKPPSPIIGIGENSGKFSIKTLEETRDIGGLVASANPSISMLGSARELKIQMPKKSSDKVDYKEATV